MKEVEKPATRVCDVLIAGAGLAGLTAAIAFARAGFDVVSLRRGRADGARPHRRDARPVGRLSRIRSGSGRRSSPARRRCAGLRIIDDTGALFPPRPVEFHCSEIGLETFGWNVENDRMADALAVQRGADAGARAHHGARRGLRLRRGKGAWRGSRTGAASPPPSSIGADGRASRARRAAGLSVRSHRYPQSALTALPDPPPAPRRLLDRVPHAAGAVHAGAAAADAKERRTARAWSG